MTIGTARNPPSSEIKVMRGGGGDERFRRLTASVLSAVVAAVDRHPSVDGFQRVPSGRFVQNGFGQLEESLLDVDIRFGRCLVEPDAVLPGDLGKVIERMRTVNLMG